MNNRERAAQIISDQGKDTICNEPECLAQDLADATDAAHALADAGLLAPDTDHPATLTTEADFTHAPVGTIVTRRRRVAIKHGEDEWSVTGDDMSRRNDTVGDLDEEDPYTVLRWGKGEEKQ